MIETLTKLNAELERTLEIARTRFPSKSFPEPKIEMDLTGKCAGLYCSVNNLIRFNFNLLMENKQDFINETIAHEVAHLVTHVIDRSSKPHGSTWRAIMKLFGIANPGIYHEYDVAPVKRQKKPYLYKCNCQEHHFTTRKHRNVMNGAQYSCIYCKSRCQFVEFQS